MEYTFQTLKVSRPEQGILLVELNRPEKLNAMNKQFWSDVLNLFTKVGTDRDARVIIIAGSGRMFTAGLDLQDHTDVFAASEGDPARRAYNLKTFVEAYQAAFTAIQKAPQPVIAAVHGGCVGGGVDLICACDIRVCTNDAWFTIKEIDIAMAADVGTLQRLPKIVGSDSFVRELAYTGRKLAADEALKRGFVSYVYENANDMRQKALSLAKTIASKSPIALVGTKEVLNYSRDHSVEVCTIVIPHTTAVMCTQDGLRYVATWNMSMLQTQVSAVHQCVLPEMMNMNRT